MYKFYCSLVLFCFWSSVYSQECINAGLIAENDSFVSVSNEYIVTGNERDQSGAVWGADKVNLNIPFDFQFLIFLGENNDGADGVAFVLRSETSIRFGNKGLGLGFEGILNSLGVEFDTYQNKDEINDPVEDHTAIAINGNTDHNNELETLFGPVLLPNLEDGRFHKVRFIWDPVLNNFSYFFDDRFITEIKVDLISIIGSDEAVWGFTGSTGLFFNEQKICVQKTIIDDDIDNDGITNMVECNGVFPCVLDSDNDGITNDLDLDSDGDGCFDTVEAGFSDMDGDGLLGVSPIVENSRGLVIGEGGYIEPLDFDKNGVFDFLEKSDFKFEINYNPKDLILIEEEGGSVSFSFVDETLITEVDIVWQISNDNGENWEDLFRDASFSGVSTANLQIDFDPLLNCKWIRFVVSDLSDSCRKTDFISEPYTVNLNIKPLTVFNAISNNGDGKNDFLVIKNIEFYNSIELKIFNRWGALVYDTDEYDNKAKVFKGRVDTEDSLTILLGQKELPAGVYFYHIEALSTCLDKTEEKTGYLYLVD